MKFSIKDFFSKCEQICRKLRIWSHLLKNFLIKNFIFCAVRTQLKQTNLENRLYILTESPKEDFSATVFQHFVDKLKHCNSDRRMDLQVLVPVFWFLYSIYLVTMFSFRMIFRHNLFCSTFFSSKICNTLVPCYMIDLQFLMKIFRNKLFALAHSRFFRLH